MQKIFGFFSIVALGALSFYAAQHLKSDGNQPPRLEWQQNCDLQSEACVVELSDGAQLRFEMLPRPLPLMKTMEVNAALSSENWMPRQLTIVGTNMEMGINRSDLSPTSSGVWQGETILPLCSQRHMKWEAQLLLQGPTGLIVVPFAFETMQR